MIPPEILNSVVLTDNVKGCELLPSESIDMVLTSPPYDDLRDYGGHSWDFEGIAAELERVVKPGGVIVWVVGDSTKDGSETGESFRQALGFMELGLRLHDTMIYSTNKPPMVGPRYQASFEFMFVISKGAPKTFNPIKERSKWAGASTSSTRYDKAGTLTGRRREVQDEKVKGNIWHYLSGATSADSNPGHPAVFPSSLAKDHISSWTQPGDVVLDPFMGSGTTAEAAVELSRDFVGFEINPEYYELWKKRTAQGMLTL